MTILWTPSSLQFDEANITVFRSYVNDQYGMHLRSYDELHQWSIDNREDFWLGIWDFCGVIATTRGEQILVDGDKMPGARFFPEARLNFAENLLRRYDDHIAITFRCENGWSSNLSYEELYIQVAKLAGAMRDAGLQSGDRVVAILPNIPEAIIGMLAAASIGAIWSSCSPDFGVQGVLDRFQQIEPKLLIACDGYLYNGNAIPVLDKIGEIAQELTTLEHIVIVPFLEQVSGVTGELAKLPKAQFIASFSSANETLEFAQLPFNHPLYIVFSSGTTGLPKCIVHGAGGTLLQHMKEHQLHCNIKPGDRVFYFTTCGWMMWNWLVSTLASKATICLYDGSPFCPDGNVLFDYIEKESISFFGTSAKYIQALGKNNLIPKQDHDFSALRTIASTGSPLLPEGFDYVYDNIKSDVCLSSICGGTDIVSCFILGNPAGVVQRGEIQVKGLGQAVDVWDENGQSIIGQKGELVCTRAFPSMPVGFWDDPDGSRYHAAYFEKFPTVWAHGDLLEQTEHGGLIVYGRSDAVLNPGGVRIGTSELYRQVELFDEVVESVAVGQNWQGDVRILLFVVLNEALVLDDELKQRLNEQIRTGASPRHVPAMIIQVPEIPHTRSGKITELAIRDVVHGHEVKNIDSIANPDALDHFKQS